MGYMPQKMNDQPHRHFFIRIFQKTHCTDETRLLLFTVTFLCLYACRPCNCYVLSLLPRHGCQERNAMETTASEQVAMAAQTRIKSWEKRTTLCFVDRASRYNCVKKNQLDAQLILSLFRQPLHVSAVSRPIIRRYNCMYTTIGIYYSF